MDAIKTLFLQAIHSRAGMAVQWLVGLLLGYLTSQLAIWGIEIPADILAQVQIGLTALGAYLVTSWVQWYQSRQTRQLQQEIGANPDGWLGPKTLQQASELSRK